MVYAIILLLIACLALYGIMLGYGYVSFPEKLMDRKTTILASLCIFLMTVDVGATWAYFLTPTPQEAASLAKGRIYAAVTAYVMRKRMDLPISISPQMTINDIQSDSNRIVFDMTINASTAEDFLHNVADIEADLKANGCAREDYKTFFEHGMGVEFHFHMTNAWGASPFMLTPEACGY